ncbi:MAG: carbohydrate ABC transporter permease [Oscillospiraceae bacterium]|jgi:putative aldouronate transport system permease protein|nr:carbohydrate ABC transporter permease [Oscillospiraceae bacterium]
MTIRAGASSVTRKKRRVGLLIGNIVIALVAVCCVVPLLYIIAISFSDELALVIHGYRLIPATFSTLAYEFVASSPMQLVNSYVVTITVTTLGTAGSLTVTAMLAYAMSRKGFLLGRKINFAVFFTMIFNVGLVPWYILNVRYYHLNNTLFALILPYLIVPWNVFLLKGFLAEFPDALIEAARIDGSGEAATFFRIVLPNCKPALATVGLFIAFMYWNDWWLGMLYIEKNALVPLQLMLYRIMNNIEFLSTSLNTGYIPVTTTMFPNESARMAMCVLATGPMLVVFPFFQKYFVKGLTVGAVKG